MSDYVSRSEHALVSAVIPTRNRPVFLACAIRSALRQTWPNIEVIVVVDGPDAETAAVLEKITDPRLRVVFCPTCCGGSEARNAGVRVARGEWVGFLDDDDEWLPEKIEAQMRAAHAMPDWFPVVSCRLIAQSLSASRILPAHPYQSSQPIADFLFCRSGLRDSGGVMQTSTLLAPRELLLALPFQSGLDLHQDWDWLIRAASYKGVGLSMVRRPLSIWRVEDARETVSRAPSWQKSLAWIRASRQLISPRAFSWFVAIQCCWRAQRSHAGLGSRLTLLRAFLFEGKPEFLALLTFLLFAFVPTSFRQRLRRGFRRNGYRPDSSSGLRLVFTRKAAAPILRKSSL